MPEVTLEDGDLVLTFDLVRGPRQREVFARRDDGRWDRREFVWGGCDWRFVESEIVDELTADAGAEVVA